MCVVKQKILGGFSEQGGRSKLEWKLGVTPPDYDGFLKKVQNEDLHY